MEAKIITIMHFQLRILADAFIQSDLHLSKATYLGYTFVSIHN